MDTHNNGINKELWSLRIFDKLWLFSKLNKVALLIADPPPAKSTTMHSWLIRIDCNLCLGGTALFPQSGKTAVTVEPKMQFKNPLGFECNKSVKHICFNDFLCYLFLVKFGGTVKVTEEEEYLPN